VILSDINMPGMEGLQLLGAINERFPDLPVMMVTAYGDDERRRRAGELGAADSHRQVSRFQPWRCSPSNGLRRRYVGVLSASIRSSRRSMRSIRARSAVGL
jgi:CheY-like chemotaxis protein